MLMVASDRAGRQYDGAYRPSEAMQGETLAVVDGRVLLAEELQALGLPRQEALEWAEDQLLAGLAESRGLDNSFASGAVRERARQLLLRDELLCSVYESIPFPDAGEVLAMMAEDSLGRMVERQYYHILLADSAMADSVRQLLEAGRSFQLLAEELSMGQKAGLGGDLGCMTELELLAAGFPPEAVVREGMGGPTESDAGWHLLLVTDEMPLTDTSRVTHAIAGHMYEQRRMAARDSLVEVARERFEVRLAPDLAGPAE